MLAGVQGTVQPTWVDLNAGLAGCVGGNHGTPAGPAQLTITATSGTMTQTTNVTLTVN